MLTQYGFTTFNTKGEIYGSFEHGPRLDIFNTSNELFEKRACCIGPMTVDENFHYEESYAVIDYVDKQITKIIHYNLSPSMIYCSTNVSDKVQIVNTFLYFYTLKINHDFYINSMELHFLVHLADKYPRWYSIFRVFSFTTNITIFISIFIFSIDFTFISSTEITKKENCWKTSPFYPLNLWAVLLGATFKTSQTNCNTRILILSWIVFATGIDRIFQ